MSGGRAHPRALTPAYDPAANRLGSPEDWEHDHQPGRPVAVPGGYLLVQVTNGIPTSRGNHAPGDVIALPHDEARALLRSGRAREVLSTA